MKELRDIIQAKLEEIDSIKTTAEVPDAMLEEGTTYFSYTLRKNYMGSDFDKNYTYRISLFGYIKRLQNNTENTLEIVDEAMENIEKKLKDLNIKCNFADVTVLDGIRKIQVQGEARYNEINKGII